MLTAFAVVLPPLALLAGWMTWTRLPCGVETREDRLEAALAIVLCAVFGTGMIGLLLAELGILRPPALASALGAVTLGLWRLPRRTPSQYSWSLRDVGGAAIVVALAAATVAPASEDLLGGRDPGTYSNTGSWLAREGTLRMRAEALTTIPADTRQLFYAASDPGPQAFMYGFFVAGDGAEGEIIPQFLHVLPVYLAIGHWLGGVTTAFLVPPSLGILAALAVYVFVRRMLGPVEAVTATAMLTLNLAQIWATRNPITEGASQLGVFAMLWCLTRAIETSGVRWGVLGGLALGTCFLLRVDALLLLPAVVPPLVLVQGAARASTRWLTHAFLPIAVAAAAWGSAHGWLFSRPYVRELGTMIASLWVLTAVVLVACGAALRNRDRLASITAWMERLGRVLWMVSALVLSAAFVFALWVRPHLEPFRMLQAAGVRSYDEEALVRVAWYFSVPGLILAFVGVLVLLYRWLVQRRIDWAPFLFVLLAFSCLYFWRQWIFPDHPWAMRRYLPVIVPGICVGLVAAAAALWSLGGRLRLLARGAAVAIVAIVMWHEIGLARPFWGFEEKQGLIASLDRIARLIPRDGLVLFSYPGTDLFVTTPLAFHLGRSVLPVVRTAANDPLREHRSRLFEAQIARWLRDGRQVFYLTSTDGNSVFATPNVRWEPAGGTRVTIRSFGTNLRGVPRAPATQVIAYHVGRATWVPDTLEACAPAAIRADALLVGRSEGFLRLESRENVRFRWLRPEARLLFASCDRARGRPSVLRIRAACGPRAATADCQVQVSVNGMSAGTMGLTDAWATYDLPVPAAAAAAPTGPFDVGFKGPRPVPPTGGMGPNRRAVSFQLASVALVPGANLAASGAVSGGVAAPPAELNLISQAAQDVWGVHQHGFYDEERSDGRMFRWTKRQARVVVRLGRSRPTAVRFEMSRAIRPGGPVRISANGCRLFDGVPPRTEWDAVFSLGACDIAGDELTIAIEAEAVRPLPDTRELAVAVRSVRIE